MTLWRDSAEGREYRRNWQREFRKRNPEYQREMYLKHRDRRIKDSQDWYKNNLIGTFENKLKSLLYVAKRRAKRKGIDFAVTRDDFEKMTHCPLLGIEFCFSNGREDKANSPSIDRIDPSLGYVPGNVWIISMRANQIKSDSSVSELEALAKNLKRKILNNKPHSSHARRT
jgi:hypothetical protein